MNFRRLTSSPGFTAGFVGAAFLIQLTILRLVFSANQQQVYLLGKEFGSTCSFKQHFGHPCPTCGMTRSVILSLHGEIAQAWQVNPAGILLVLGIALFSAAMLVLFLYQQLSVPTRSELLRSRIQTWALAYGIVLAITLISHWVVELVGY